MHVGHFEPQYALWVRRNSQQINAIGGKSEGKTMDSSQKKWSFKWKRLVRCVDGAGLVLAWPRYLGVGCVWVAWPRDLFFLVGKSAFQVRMEVMNKFQNELNPEIICIYIYICSRLSCLQIDLPKKNHRLSCWTCNKSTSSCGSPMIGNTNGNWYLTVELLWQWLIFLKKRGQIPSNCQKGRVYHLSFRGWDGRWFPSKLVGGVDRTCPSYLVISGSLFGYQQSNLEMEDMLQGLGKYWLWKMAILSISLQIHRLRLSGATTTIQLIFHELLGERGLVRISWLTRHAANSRFAVRFAGTNLKAQAFLMPSQRFLFSGCAIRAPHSPSKYTMYMYVSNFIHKWIVNDNYV